MFFKAIPNIFTLGNLFLGMVSIILVFEGEPQYAAIAVIVGMLLDGLDGRLARILKVQSEFGKQLDSLSDVISFGVAPAVIMYVVALKDMGPMGWIFAGIFPICGALRLAKFNISSGNAGYFVGLPITAAGGVLATMALYSKVFTPFWLAIGMLGLSYLMISRIKYPNFKKVGIPKAVYWVTPLIILVVAVVAARFPNQFPKIVFLPLVLYAYYGVQSSIRLIFRKMKKYKEPAEEDIHM
ncbi:CDP-diacylglycerol--serine O-phosphatidyltransferase [Microaerobacter geothermalis]|uniref:CDP-diacylglycerol--serine O-phosphatidyltransferase n=1 Tax=Microaerobacter geothermalis TaxID=674972 RepID=UPI001F44ADC6|nr:CDP-diacylglycerol--serine O-phosphatidyltransferase [Microaerobacter geothermalis]MCF6095186.1 CDP-diacylglycerol--serine O-phosphatidyltransferase [Microaerobacter geothermalis]